MIPKKIHYIWLGGREMDPTASAMVEGWRRILPDYEIIEWNETNLNFTDVPQYVRSALSHERWAFVTDYFRLSILNTYGGIYLDTDVEILRSLDTLLENKAMMSFESDTAFCTAVIGSEPNQGWLRFILAQYESRSFEETNGKLDMTPNSEYIYQLYRLYPEQFNDLTVFPSEYFSPLYYYSDEPVITKNTYAIHWFSGTWRTKGELLRDRVLRLLTKIFGNNFVPSIRKLFRIS